MYLLLYLVVYLSSILLVVYAPIVYVVVIHVYPTCRVFAIVYVVVYLSPAYTRYSLHISSCILRVVYAPIVYVVVYTTTCTRQHTTRDNNKANTKQRRHVHQIRTTHVHQIRTTYTTTYDARQQQSKYITEAMLF